MSYDIVRGASVAADGTVTIKSHSSNVWPRTDSTWNMSYRNEHNPFTGKLGGEIEVFAGFEQGNFHGAVAKYQRQLEVLRHMPEYRERYDWRGNWDATRETRDNDKRGYYELLARAWRTPAPKPRFVITKTTYAGQTLYFKHRKNSGFCRWQLSAKGANLYRYRDDAEAMRHGFTNSDGWQVVEVEV